MRIFTRYMAGRFFKAFAFGLGLFAVLIFLVDLFDNMNKLAKSRAPLPVILEYLWLGVPYWTVRVLPMATLLATIAALTDLIRSGEWIGAQACGFKTRDFWKPLLYCAAAVTALSFAAQETISPACFRRAKHLLREVIHPEWEWDKHYDIAVAAGPGLFLRAKLLLPKAGTMERPVLERVGPRGVQRQWDAAEAVWDGARQRWSFKDGYERTFAPDGGVRQEAFALRTTELTIPPKTLMPRQRNPDEMSLRELAEYEEGVRRLGAPTRELEVAAHAKLAAPFVNLIICALGIPVALRLRSSTKTASFLAALGLSFLYLWFMEMSRALGVSGRLPAPLAAWLPNAIFGAVAAGLISRYE